MADFYGAGVMMKIFGGEKGMCIINRACKWGIATPERYALMQCFAELDSDTMFSAVRMEDRLEAKLQELQKSNVTWTKKQVMEQMGVTASQLVILTRKYGIAPFWRRIGGEADHGQHKLILVLNDDEYRIYEAARNASGYRYDRHFIKYCVLEFIKGSERDRSTWN